MSISHNWLGSVTTRFRAIFLGAGLRISRCGISTIDFAEFIVAFSILGVHYSV
jgi:hypothetical protein